MATLPLNVQPRKGETIEQFQRRVAKARAAFIEQRRPTKQRLVPERQQAADQQTARRNPGHEPRFCSSLVKTVRAQWLAGLRIDDIARRWAMTANNVRNFCHDWERRADCIPSASDVQLYRSVGYSRKLPDGPKLDARLMRWIDAVAAQAKRNRGTNRNNEQ